MFWFWLGGVFVGMITCSDIIKQLNDTELNNEWAATAAEKIPDSSAPWILPDYEVLEAWENMREIYKRKVSDVTLTLKPIIDDFLKTINVSEDCYQSVMTVLTSFGKMETWSTKMIDSNGRLPSGLLEGTLTSLGSYDQCLDIISPNTSHYVTTFQGQYCSVLFRPPLPARSPKYLSIAAGVKILSNFSKPGEVFHHLAQNAQFFYFAALRIGICVPSTCTIHDVQKIATKVGGWLKLKGSVQNCEVKSAVQLTARQIVSICILSAILFLVVTGSALDVYRNVLRKKNQAAPEEKQGKMEEFFGCFSLRSNFLKLFSTKSSEQTIKSIHGIRFLTIIWIIMAHTVNEYHYGMMSGVFNLKTQVGYFDNQFLVQASISVDTFFCISGFLTMYYVWFYTGGKAEKLNVWKFILIRYFRLTPPLVLTLCILFILPLLGSGPVWSEVLMPYVEGCYSTWWRNLLYINTLYEPVKCLGQTWYISCDFIYHVLSLTIFLPMLRNPKSGIIIIFFFLLTSIAGTTVLTWYFELPPTLFAAMLDKREVLKMSQKRYPNPINHLGCYCVGLLAGYALARKKLTNVSKIILALGWISSMFSFMSVIYGMYDWNRGIEGSTAVALMYAGLHRPVWAAAVAWLILMCVTGRGSVINTLLSWKPFISLDRLTYMVYLIHHVIVYVYNGYVRNLINTKEITIAYIMFGHILLSYLISAICVLLVESPFFAIRQKFLSRSRGRKLVTQTTNDEATGDTELVEKTIVRNGGACHS